VSKGGKTKKLRRFYGLIKMPKQEPKRPGIDSQSWWKKHEKIIVSEFVIGVVLQYQPKSNIT